MTDKDKPPFDEETLEKVLQAAFLLQEHQQELQDLKQELAAQIKTEPTPPEVIASNSADPLNTVIETHEEEAPEKKVKQDNDAATLPAANGIEDYTRTLSYIAEIQGKIEAQDFDVNQAMRLITDELVDLAGAAGAAIGFIHGKTVRYRAAAGFRTPPLGAFVPLDRAACRPCVRSAQPFRCLEVNQDRSVNQDEFRGRGISSFIAVPVFSENKVAGGLELYYSDPHAFTEQDVHTCQLMAALLTDALSRDRNFDPDEEPVPLSPDSDKSDVAAQTSVSEIKNDSADTSGPRPDVVECYRCGHSLFGDEQFCGQCGAPRDQTPAPVDLQSKVASLWHRQANNDESESPDKPLSFGKLTNRSDLRSSPNSTTAVGLNILPAEVCANAPAIATVVASEIDPASGSVVKSSPVLESEPALETAPQESASTRSSRFVDWSSALSARDFLEQFAGNTRRRALLHFWNTRRGDIYLVVAIVLVAGVICWGLWPSHPANVAPPPKATTTGPQPRTQPAAPELSLLDRMLVSIGLAEAPPVPVDRGNPAVQVWVDLHTALYYCPGADLYGKTSTGKYTTQREAQLDQFEPAYRKTCN